ncbi:prepilin-type N-terminal cleavage/methylation domain-containing protein [Citrobacter sp. JL978]|uniref:prepilin-type N-terminal cleavage/methylation domain-containing protein n=1 Tax=Citrobacter sp. JL978 TaxID=2652398 RepID=UPI0012D97AC2|nr:prepilin-type N-terminal cleavage/methylation domain-containing protein [Citrobacter sp. JL978]MTZ80077.1 prepilin-type N-terminal cleavage/methylation domain-containing protein [Citrobacter sp. JL978]
MKNMIHSWKRKSAQYRELKKQKGVTLLEIIIVLGIIGIIAAGVVVLAQRAFKAQDISDVIENTNSVRVAMAEAYKDEASYPLPTGSVIGLTKANIAATANNDAPIVGLVRMGKIDVAEAFNGISSDAFEIGPSIITTGATVNKGFYVVINGLEVEDCRNLASQVGPQWDYVASGTAASGAQLGSTTPIDMAAGATGVVLKSLAGNRLSPVTISAAGFCDATASDNALILGSR